MQNFKYHRYHKLLLLFFSLILVQNYIEECGFAEGKQFYWKTYLQILIHVVLLNKIMNFLNKLLLGSNRQLDIIRGTILEHMFVRV